MGKHKDRPPLADWEVKLTSGSSVTVAQAWYERAKGEYVFHDEAGICYTFPSFNVTYVRRADPEPVPAHHPASGSGGASSAGFPLDVVAMHAGDYSEAAR